MEAPVWTQLDKDLHLQTLSHDYAPAFLLEMIDPSPKEVLDVGCFCGGSGRWIKSKFPGARVTGIEMLARAAAMAAESYDHVVVKQFEAVDFASDGLRPASFNAIILADVLEHMFNPWQALERLRPLVAEGGALYASIPNIRNLRVLSDLIAGRWTYAGSGILDITHVRFFTYQAIDRMFAETGWKIVTSGINPDPAVLQTLGGRNPASITNIESEHMTLRKLTPADMLELVALQFLVKAQPQI